jgi:Domain of unknown function (DUF4288)
MNWYLTKMVFRIQLGGGTHKAQFDEQLRIILASDAEAALDKARRFAEEEKRNASNSYGMVKWQFINVTEIYRLNNYVDGAEIFSQIQEAENGDLYEEKINRKAANTLHNLQNRLLEIY